METVRSSNLRPGIRRKAVDLESTSLVTVGLLEPEENLPLVIRPAIGPVDLAEWARVNSETIEKYLLKHGTILFRGFGLDSVGDFERVCSAGLP